MDARPWIAVLLIVQLLAPFADAQEVEPATDLLVLEDAADDLAVSVQGQPVDDQGRFQNLDLRALYVTETKEAFRFRLEVAGLDDETLLEAGALDVHFEHHGQPYRINFDDFLNIDPGSAMPETYVASHLYRFDATSDRDVYVGPTETLVEGQSFSATVGRDLLVDPSGGAPFPGRELTGFYVTSTGNYDGLVYLGSDQPLFGAYAVHDAMPDQEVGSVTVPVAYGLVQSGHVRLESPEPVRASNGEATTFYYEVVAHSLGPHDIYTPYAVDVPAGWTVKFETDEVHVAERNATTFLVQVQIPFGHKHGETTSFVVELKSRTDPQTVGRISLGVHYLDVPQPAGHHDTLYLHADEGLNFGGVNLDQYLTSRGQEVGQPFMNTLEQDGTGRRIPANAGLLYAGDPQAPSRYDWSVPLLPGLRMGVDQDLARTGEWTFQVEVLKPMPGASFDGELYVYQPEEPDQFGFVRLGDPILLGTLESSGTKDLGPNSVAGFTGEYRPSPDAGYVPYRRGAVLLLELHLRGELPRVDIAEDAPFLESGGSLRLPLNEYADTVADANGFVVTEEFLDLQEQAFQPDTTEAKPTPGVGPWLAVVLLLGLVRRRLDRRA